VFPLLRARLQSHCRDIARYGRTVALIQLGFRELFTRQVHCYTSQGLTLPKLLRRTWQGRPDKGISGRPVASNMPLQFITEGAIGPKERKLIRSHVMKGKNAGKTRPARRTLLHSNGKSRQDDHQPTPLGYDHSKGNEPEALDCRQTLHMKRLFWNDLSLASFPQPVSPNLQNAIYKCELKPDVLPVRVHRACCLLDSGLWHIAKVLYPPQFCVELDLSQYVWFQYVLQDEACRYRHHIIRIMTLTSRRFSVSVGSIGILCRSFRWHSRSIPPGSRTPLSSAQIDQ
jgi:hypothetical protein